MIFRSRDNGVTDEEERRATEALRALVSGAVSSLPEPPSGEYWVSLPLRVNRRIDELTSGKALSVSWALRVAAPGIVAVVSFLIGLSYYAPPSTRDSGSSLPRLVASFGDEELEAVAEDFAPYLAGFETDTEETLSLSAGAAEEYLIGRADLTGLVDALSERETEEILAVLESPSR
ncbi:MAG: hypothetical protein WB626_06225 [Bacteroidota bacterium]